MKKALKYLAWGLATLLVLALIAYAALHQVAKSRYERRWDEVHAASFAVPFPLSTDELAALSAERIAAGASPQAPLAGIDLQAVALQHAVARGRYLVESRTSCNACHGLDFGGHAVVDVAIVGHWVAPNLTAGEGSVTRGYTPADWDRAVRHAIRRNGQSSSMPSKEFANLSDHELSDIVAYISSMPPVDRDLGPVSFGPVFDFLVATDASMLPATSIDHAKPHDVEPPPEVVNVALGQHITQVCIGCHDATLSGGKLQGDPDMPIVANLTPHATGLKGWTEADFLRALRDGKRPDGTAISTKMPWKAYGQMNDTELKAVYAYLQTVPALPKGSRR